MSDEQNGTLTLHTDTPRPEMILGSIDTTDRRSIDDVPLAIDYSERSRGEQAEKVRALLRKYGVHIVDQINYLGCTGIMLVAGSVGQAVEDGTQIRLGLAGCGTGLPCFVPPTRFCLVHNTIGGLEPRQKQLYPAFVDRISRELTEAERNKVDVLQQARKLKSKEEVVSFMAGATSKESTASKEDAFPTETPDAAVLPWVCEEHQDFVWACRFCIAQAVVEGQLEPSFIVAPAVGDSVVCQPAEVENNLKIADEEGATAAAVYVCVASYTRRLARD